MSDDQWCLKCGQQLRHNVPRLGPDGGFVHKKTGSLECEIPDLVDHYFATATPEQLEADLKASNFDEWNKIGAPIIMNPPPTTDTTPTPITDKAELPDSHFADQGTSAASGYVYADEMRQLERDNARLREELAIWRQTAIGRLELLFKQDEELATLKTAAGKCLDAWDKFKDPDDFEPVMHELSALIYPANSSTDQGRK